MNERAACCVIYLYLLQFAILQRSSAVRVIHFSFKSNCSSRELPDKLRAARYIIVKGFCTAFNHRGGEGGGAGGGDKDRSIIMHNRPVDRSPVNVRARMYYNTYTVCLISRAQL